MILVTGGAGYIGSHTIIDLIENKFSVVSIDNFIRSNKDTFERIKNITGTSVINYNIDLTNLNNLQEFFSKNYIETIIHFAALKSVPESIEQPYLYYKNNLDSLSNLLYCCNKFNVKNFIFSSSCTVYGNPKTFPVTEESPTGDIQSPYGYTKWLGEQLIEYFSKTSETKFLSLRYFNPAGAHSSGLIGERLVSKSNANLVAAITNFAIGNINEFKVFGIDYPTRDGSCIRDYIHVSDLARAHSLGIDFLNTSASKYNVINLGIGQGVTVLEAIKAFENVSGKKINYEIAPRRFGDIAAIYSDSSKALSKLKWKAKYNIEDIMHTAWAWENNLKAEYK